MYKTNEQHTVVNFYQDGHISSATLDSPEFEYVGEGTPYGEYDATLQEITEEEANAIIEKY